MDELTLTGYNNLGSIVADDIETTTLKADLSIQTLNLTVLSNASVAGDLTVAGNQIFEGGLTVDSYLEVSGNSVFKGSLYADDYAFIDTLQVSGLATMNSSLIIQADLQVRSGALVEFGKGISKEVNAGKVGYRLFSSGLDVVGAGAGSNNRLVKLWDDVEVQRDLRIYGTATVGSFLTVNNDTTIHGNLTVNDDIFVNADVFTDGTNSSAVIKSRDAFIDNLITASFAEIRSGTITTLETASATILHGLKIAGGAIQGFSNGTANQINLQDDVDISRNLLVRNSLTVSSGMSIRDLSASSLIVRTSALVTCDLNVASNQSIYVGFGLPAREPARIMYNYSAPFSLEVIGGAANTTSARNIIIHSNLQVNGSSLIWGNVAISGNTTVAGSLVITGRTTVSDNVYLNTVLQVQGHTTLSSSLYVTGAAIFNSTVQMNRQLTVNAPIAASGNISGLNVVAANTVSAARVVGERGCFGSTGVETDTLPLNIRQSNTNISTILGQFRNIDSGSALISYSNLLNTMSNGLQNNNRFVWVNSAAPLRGQVQISMDSMNLLITRNSTLQANAPLTIYHSYTDLVNDTPAVVAKFANANADLVSNAFVSFENSSTNVSFPSARWLMGLQSDGNFSFFKSGGTTNLILDTDGHSVIPATLTIGRNAKTTVNGGLCPLYVEYSNQTTGSLAAYFDNTAAGSDCFMMLENNNANAALSNQLKFGVAKDGNLQFFDKSGLKIMEFQPAGTCRLNDDLFMAANGGTWNSTEGKGLYMRYSANGTQDAAYIQAITRSSSTLQRMILQGSDLWFGLDFLTSSAVGGRGKFNYYGLNSSEASNGCHASYYVSGSDHPTFQIFNWANNNLGLLFDAYYSAGLWRSSNSTSNFSIYKANEFLYFQYNRGTSAGASINWSNAMTISSSQGRIMIGRTAGSQFGHVTITDTVSTVFSGYGYLNTGGAGGNGATSPYLLNLYCPNIIAASAYVAFSDRRIKKDIVELEDGECLSLIRKLKPCRYRYIDTHQRGDQEILGFIAQEVREVFPQAANVSAGVIPDLMRKGRIENGFLLNEPTLIGKLVKFYNIENAALTAKILQDGRVEFPSEDLDKQFNNQEVWLYGTQIDDFYHLDKQSLIAPLVAAVQELDRENSQLKQQVSELKDTFVKSITKLEGLWGCAPFDVLTLKEENEALKARVSSLESNLASLTAILRKKFLI